MSRADGVILLAASRVSGDVVPARAQMAATLGFHIILACLGVALPAIALLAEFIGLRRHDETAMRLARHWSPHAGDGRAGRGGRGDRHGAVV
jgi:cytochrome d ubiquinol oxidase subunit I